MRNGACVIARMAGNANHALIVDGTEMAAADLKAWSVFLQRFAAERAKFEDGCAILFLTGQQINVERMHLKSWSGRLRRVDAMIWAELNSPADRSGLLHILAVNLAVELCGWRLGLVADLVTQREEDLFAPKGWLTRSGEMASVCGAVYDGRTFACPIQLWGQQDDKELASRIWRAQLSALFPWIEEKRLRILERYRDMLQLTDRQLEQRVTEVEDMELGAMGYQLRSRIARAEYDHIRDLAEMRNDLAHRKPVQAHTLERAYNFGR